MIMIMIMIMMMMEEKRVPLFDSCRVLFVTWSGTSMQIRGLRGAAGYGARTTR
jgi:AMMECR1 domain-containing protein